MPSRNYSILIDLYLERFEQGLAIDNAGITFLFANFRQLLEQRNLKNTHPTLNFYCNWLLHEKITTSAVGRNILASIVPLLTNTAPNSPAFIDGLNQLFVEQNLRDDIVALCRSQNIRNSLTVSDANWRGAFSQLLSELTNKPIIPDDVINPRTTLRITNTNLPTVTTPSYISLWIHGQPGQQAEWSIAIVPQGQNLDLNNLGTLPVYNGGVFTRP